LFNEAFQPETDDDNSADLRDDLHLSFDPRAADYLRIKRSRLDALRRQGRVAATKLGKAFTYRRADLESLRESLR